MKFARKINISGFTLFELMVSMAIFGLIMISVFDAVGNIWIARTKSMSRITLLEELYFFSEKLTTAIKDGGIVDYEEYWNRQMVGTGTASGHYLIPTGFGNYGSGGVLITSTYWGDYYYCRSGDIGGGGTRVWTGWCIAANVNTSWVSQSWVYQRYGQYIAQYNDYNGNADADGGILWDEDGNGNIRWDEDDKDIGDGPIVLSGSSPELYLYNAVTKGRTFFRWTYKDDPDLPTGTCNYGSGSGCLGNIEILRLQWKDIGMNHSGSVTASGAFDGNIDTWVCHPDWTCGGPTLAWYGVVPTWNDSEWVKMFPDYISVRKIWFTIYPRKDPWRSWWAPDDLATSGFVSPFIHPYVRIQMTLGLAWDKRRLIKWDDPTIAISTTISLSNTTIQ